jgi:hypothetical protein
LRKNQDSSVRAHVISIQLKDIPEGSNHLKMNVTTDWKDQKMFLEELDTLTIECQQLNVDDASSSSAASSTTNVISNNKNKLNSNPKKVKGKKNKKNKKSMRETTAAKEAFPPMGKENVSTRLAPHVRGGATMTYLPTTKEILILGGADRTGNEYGFKNVFFYDIMENVWSKRITKGTMPGPRNGHTSTLVQTCYNELYCLDVETMCWCQCIHSKDSSNEKSVPPSARNGHTGCAVAGTESTSIYYFGGSSPTNGLMNDIHVLNIQHKNIQENKDQEEEDQQQQQGTVQPTFSWVNGFNDQVLQKGSPPPPTPREAHTCVVLGDSLYVYGGRSNTSVNSDVIQFNYITLQWYEPINTKIANMSHGSIGFNNGRHMCVYGGCDGTQLLNQFYIYNVHENMWTEPKVKGVLPAPRMACSMAMILSNPENDVSENAVNENVVGENVVNENAVNESIHQLFIFGGSTMLCDMNDIYSIQIQNLPSINDELKTQSNQPNTIQTSNKIPKDAKRTFKTSHIKRKGASSDR